MQCIISICYMMRDASKKNSRSNKMVINYLRFDIDVVVLHQPPSFPKRWPALVRPLQLLPPIWPPSRRQRCPRLFVADVGADTVCVDVSCIVAVSSLRVFKILWLLLLLLLLLLLALWRLCCCTCGDYIYIFLYAI